LILFLFTFCSYGQEIVEKKIHSNLDEIVIEFDLIDNIRLFNNKADSDIIVRAEGSSQIPNYQLKKQNGHVLLKDYKPFDPNEDPDADKVCSIEPNYTSYQIYIPKNRTLYISFIEGNFYAEAFEGELNLKVEDGIIKLNNILDDTNIHLNSGSVTINEVNHARIEAETNLGALITDLVDPLTNKDRQKLFQSEGEASSSLIIKTIMANIYLYGSKG